MALRDALLVTYPGNRKEQAGVGQRDQDQGPGMKHALIVYD